MALESFHKTRANYPLPGSHPLLTPPPTTGRIFPVKKNKKVRKINKNQMADGQEASKAKEHTISRRTDTHIWIAQVF